MNTDELDDTYTSHLFTNALIKLREERDMFKRQRDELIEALTDVVLVHKTYIGGNDRYKLALENASAVIARVKP